jgi:hypothetical protein
MKHSIYFGEYLKSNILRRPKLAFFGHFRRIFAFSDNFKYDPRDNINQCRWRILGGEKLKKIWAIALSALLVFGIAAFTGCAEEEPVEEEPWEPVEEEKPWWPIRDEEEEPWEPEEEEPVTGEGGSWGAKIMDFGSKLECVPCFGGLLVSLIEGTLGLCGSTICPSLAP